MAQTDLQLFQKIEHEGFRGWRILRRIGEGASAVVFLAERSTQRQALKIFRSWVTQEFSTANQATRIERQLALRGHDHPHLVTIFDGGLDERTGMYYLFMAFLDQQPLSKVISRVPVERIAPLVAQVASAARFLEDAGFAHRDIKPDNIVVDADYRRATLLDVGVLLPLSGSTLTDHSSEKHVFLGTTRWSPPEFIKREEVTTPDGYRAITFYQLGAVLHDLLTGHRMFADVRDEPKAALIDAVLNKEPDLSKARPGMILRLLVLAENCLKKDPTARLKRVTWDDFSYVRLRIRPVVVLLYTGGTIGAEVAADSSHIRDFRPIDNPTDPFLTNFREKIESDYKFFLGPSSPMPFDLEWEVLPPDEQLLSENADPQTWRNLGMSLQRIFAKYVPSSSADNVPHPRIDPSSALLGGSAGATTCESTYLAGVVVLHGTDTLAFSAAALAVACQNLPCPVVVTGSNQPPRMEDVSEWDAIANQSDAWKNIRRSLVFLQTFGHRFTETFVCFGDTVHTGINIRKSFARRQPLLRRWDDVALQEPYFYRNRGSQRDYMFRSIEDLYCNNFYPLSDRISYGVLVSERAKNTFRHFRVSPTRANAPFRLLPLSDRVRLATVSPMFFPEPYRTKLEGGSSALDGVDVVVLEGYNSGTFPSRPNHPFTDLLRSLMIRAIPIVLVTRDGLLPTNEPYKLQEIDGQKLPVLRLFGVIAETAGPLIAGARGSIDDGEWQVPGEADPYKVLLRRHELLDRTIRKRQTESPGILFSLLGNIVDEVEQLKRVNEGVERDWSEYSEMVARLFASAENPFLLRMAADPRRTGRKTKTRSGNEAQEEERAQGEVPFDDSRSILMKEHFLWLLREFVRPFEMAGCGPDGMAMLNEIGFIWGQQMFERLAPGLESGTGPFTEVDGDQDSELRARIFERARHKIARLSRLLRMHGVADVDAQLSESAPRGHLPRGISLRVHWVKHNSIAKSGELYRVKDYGDDERQFFEALRKGAELDLYDADCSDALERRFDRLFRNDPGVQLSALDWFLIGIYKAAACGILVELRFDSWTDRFAHAHSSNVSALRQSVTTRIRQSSREDYRLDLEFLYAARDWEKNERWPGSGRERIISDI